VTRSLARKRVPRMVTVSPGAAVMRSRLLIDGDGSSALVYVNAPSSDAEPVAQTTPTATRFCAPGGAVARSDVALSSSTPFASTPSKATPHELMRFEPVTRTTAPPPTLPNAGATALTVGAAFAKVKALASDAVAPPSQRIETATVAAGCGGVVATSDVALVAFERTAGRPPNH